MTATTQTACPAWCDLPEGEHDDWDTAEYRMHTRSLDQWESDHPDADEPIRVYVEGGRSEDGYSWDEVQAQGSVQPGFLGGVGLFAADARRLGEALIRGADLIEGRVEGPEVRWERDSQTYLAECGCGWRYFASTLRHAQVRAGEHARDEHHG